MLKHQTNILWRPQTSIFSRWHTYSFCTYQLSTILVCKAHQLRTNLQNLTAKVYLWQNGNCKMSHFRSKSWTSPVHRTGPDVSKRSQSNNIRRINALTKLFLNAPFVPSFIPLSFLKWEFSILHSLFLKCSVVFKEAYEATNWVIVGSFISLLPRDREPNAHTVRPL